MRHSKRLNGLPWWRAIEHRRNQTKTLSRGAAHGIARGRSGTARCNGDLETHRPTAFPASEPTAHQPSTHHGVSALSFDSRALSLDSMRLGIDTSSGVRMLRGMVSGQITRPRRAGFCLAAKQGHADAQHFLGMSYATPSAWG